MFVSTHIVFPEVESVAGRINRRWSFYWVLISFSLAACKTEIPDAPLPPEPPVTGSLREQYSTTPDKWPAANWYEGVSGQELGALPDPPGGTTSEVRELGKVLFFDNRIGGRDNSCASCHVPQNHWIDKVMVASGGGNRNTPTMENVWYLNGHLMHDGRAATFAEQITIAIESPHEMAGKLDDIPRKLGAVQQYKPLFKSAYGDDQVTVSRVLEALEDFSKSIVSSETPFDRFVKGDYTALQDDQLLGLHVFRTKAGCINCHNGSFFTDLQYHNLGNSLDALRQPDYGRSTVTGKYSDWGKFRTPGLRNVANTAPYLHNGSVASLDMMIDLVADGMPQMNGQRITGTLSPYIRNVGLNAEERNALLAFIGTLNSPRPEVTRPNMPL